MLLGSGPVAAEQSWYLMSRHGECSPITPAMRHKMPDFPDVQSAQALVQALRDRKMDVRSAPLPGAPDGHLTVRVPSLGWTLVVARADRCSTFVPGPR